MKHFLLILILVSLAVAGEVTYQRLLDAGSELGNWLTYSGGYASHRHSKLNQVNAGNVSRLKMLWAHQMKVTEKVETTPLAIDGVLYITRPPSDVLALDAAALMRRAMRSYASSQLMRRKPRSPCSRSMG